MPTLTWHVRAHDDGHTWHERRVPARNSAEAFDRWERTLAMRGITILDGYAGHPMTLDLDR